MKPLTDRQRHILEFIESHIKDHGYPPTIREIGARFGFSWPAARGHLLAIAKKGAIRISQFTSRGIGLSDRAESMDIPLAGAIRAGEPMPAIEHIEAKIAVDKTLFKDQESFALRVKGDSMRDAGILDGDYAVVSPKKEIKNGDIAVALIGDEATVKKIFLKQGSITLMPCNPEFKPLTLMPDEVFLIGRVTGLIRKL